MTITLTQTDATSPPVTVAVTAMPVVDTEAAGAITCLVQRSTDGVRYTTVRGMIDMAPDGSGVLTTTDDYEFRPGVVNTYRAGTMQEVASIFGGSAASAWANATTGQVWDAANAAFNTTGGFGTILHSAANTEFSTKLSALTDMGDMDMAVTFKSNAAAGGIAGGSAVVSLFAHRVSTTDGYRADITFATDDTMSVVVKALNASVTTTLATFALPNLYTANTQVFRARMRIDGPRIRIKVWEPNASPAPDWQYDEVVSAAYRVSGGAPGLGSTRSTGNSNSNLTWSFTDLTIDTGIPTYLQTQTITPDLAGFWLTSTMRSFLNIAPRVVDYIEPARSARGGAAYVAGRTLPIAQSELSGSREWTLVIRVPSTSAARRLEYVVASGDVFYLQTPADCPIPYGYYRIGDMSAERPIQRGGAVRLFNLPLLESAAPGPDVATASATWDSVIALYGTWADVVAAQPTWEDLLDLIGDPSEVVVE